MFVRTEGSCLRRSHERVNTRWTAEQIPNQQGRTAIVTGANSGLGFIVARELVRAGAHVIVATRDAGRGATAISETKAAHPAANVDLAQLDLANLASVRDFAQGLLGGSLWLDVYVNDAVVILVPHRLTPDEFYLQFGTSHLANLDTFGLLLPS